MMTVDEALMQADTCHKYEPESILAAEVGRLREENKRLRGWIRAEGGYNDTCTRQILGEICQDCMCGKALPEPAP
jgi:hypothetical protein